jgi:hypothetical protein
MGEGLADGADKANIVVDREEVTRSPMAVQEGANELAEFSKPQNAKEVLAAKRRQLGVTGQQERSSDGFSGSKKTRKNSVKMEIAS